MKTMTVNQELQFSCPDSFHVMSAEEQGKLSFLGEGESECYTDPERHILMSIGWKPLGGLASLLIRASDAAHQMEAVVKQPMQQYGYKAEGPKAVILGGEKASGFRYGYEAGNIAMVGESLACKRGKTMYYLHVYYRESLREECASVWDEILSSVRWIG